MEETRGCLVACQLRRGRRNAGSASAAMAPVGGIVTDGYSRKADSNSLEKGGCRYDNADAERLQDCPKSEASEMDRHLPIKQTHDWSFDAEKRGLSRIYQESGNDCGYPGPSPLTRGLDGPILLIKTRQAKFDPRHDMDRSEYDNTTRLGHQSLCLTYRYITMSNVN